jgi:hypothetical protein
VVVFDNVFLDVMPKAEATIHKNNKLDIMKILKITCLEEPSQNLKRKHVMGKILPKYYLWKK